MPSKAHQKAKRKRRATRPQIVIDQRCDRRKISGDVQRDCDVLGVIQEGNGASSVLCRMHATGALVWWCYGELRVLLQLSVRHALETRRLRRRPLPIVTAEEWKPPAAINK